MCGPAKCRQHPAFDDVVLTSEGDVLDATGLCWPGFCWMGLTLDELAAVAQNQTGRSVRVLRELTPEQFEEHLQRANDTGRRYIINFNRAAIFGAGQAASLADRRLSRSGRPRVCARRQPRLSAVAGGTLTLVCRHGYVRRRAQARSAADRVNAGSTSRYGFSPICDMDCVGAFVVIGDWFQENGQSFVSQSLQENSGRLAGCSPIRLPRFRDLHLNSFQHDDAGRRLSRQDVSGAARNGLSLPAGGIERSADVFHQGHRFGIKLDREIERRAGKLLDGIGYAPLGGGADRSRAIGPERQSAANQDESRKRDRQSSLPGALRNLENQKGDFTAQADQKRGSPRCAAAN